MKSVHLVKRCEILKKKGIYVWLALKYDIEGKGQFLLSKRGQVPLEFHFTN